tara:strand:- start:1948 stop:2652 length:705 start_codon:yes stop_codon:yes gene_type:complete
MNNPLPNHIAIIMDGNRTWAKNNNLLTIKGHEKGLEVAEEICIHSNKIGIKNLTLYAFSIQNWTRPKVEIDALFNLFIDFFDNKSKFFHDYKLKFQPIGRISELPKMIERKILSLKELTKDYKGTCINVAINYGGREEIIDTVNAIVNISDTNKKIDEDLFKENSYFPNTPDPELLIRTAGYSRVSNFLLWHIAYSEIDISDKLWPEFTKRDLEESIQRYKSIDRKFGGSSKNG